MRNKAKAAVPKTPEVPDVDEMKEAAAEKAEDAGDIVESAIPGNMKFMLFKLWVVDKFSCCLGSPEMTKVGAIDIPDIPDAPEMPKIGTLGA
jgi:hypothetical protein